MEIQSINSEAPKGNSFLKNLLLVIFFAAVVAASFWISFQLGKKILVPVRNKPEAKIQIAIPEPPPSIAGLQKAGVACLPPTTVKQQLPKAVVSRGRSKLYRVQVGAFKNKSNAQRLVRELKAKGIDAMLVHE